MVIHNMTSLYSLFDIRRREQRGVDFSFLNDGEMKRIVESATEVEKINTISSWFS